MPARCFRDTADLVKMKKSAQRPGSGRALFVGELVRVHTLALVIHIVLQVVGIAALLRQRKQDHRLGNENPAA